MKIVLSMLLSAFTILAAEHTLAAQKPEPTTAAPAPVAGSLQKLDVNRATVAQLIDVPGIGPRTAQAIVDLRNVKGSFTVLDDLLQVRGIKEKTLEKLSAFLEVQPAKPSSQTTTSR